MSSAGVVGYLLSALVYGVSAGFSIRFDDRRSVSTAASLAPAVVWLGMSLPSDLRHGLIVVGPGVAVVVLLLRRRPVSEAAGHVALFGVVYVTLWVSAQAGTENSLPGGLLAGALYLSGDALRQRLTRRGDGGVRLAGRRTYRVLHLVLLCACGLTVLGVQEMDWPAFAAMGCVLALTKREFEAFAQSRDAYDQTVSALDHLRSRAH